MIEADRVHSTPRTSSSSSDLKFKRIEDAEEFLKSQGFWLVENSCDWTNADGDDAGIYSIDGYWGEVLAWRVEINRRAAETKGKGLSRRLMMVGLAALPVAAAIPAAAAEPDPIFAAIERHKVAAVIYDAAVHARGTFPDLNPIGEQRDEIARLDDVVDETYDRCQDAAVDMINTEPMTLAVIVAMIQHVRIQVRNDGVYLQHHLVLDTGCDPEETMDWVDAFLDTIENAATELDDAGRAQQ
jgi:hypothetical protein